ncbi:fatty acid desaturase [Aureococcus anophagefferens]|nr:fatty acid desaturase [Aureococcus anophagefferens]
MRRVFDEAVAEAVTLEHEVRRPSVSEWHSRRRAAILKAHPEVAKLHGETAWSPVACVGVCLVHAAVAIHLLAPGAGGVDARYALRVFLLAGTVGAQCAFGAQALNHELSHAKTWAVAGPCALLASSLTTFPWFSYYFAGGHERHHAHVGTPRDADADALFWLWERVAGRRVGVAVAAALPLAYAWSLLACLRDDFKANRKETCFWLFDALCSAAAMAAVGRRCASPAHGWGAFAYFALSAANSVGFLAHPCIGFWLFQHACATDLDERSSMAAAYRAAKGCEIPNFKGSYLGRFPLAAYAAPTLAPRAKKDDDAYGALDDMQPTLSYAGSDLWHWLTFQELRHLEHHDFPGIPWTRLAALAKAAPGRARLDDLPGQPAGSPGTWWGSSPAAAVDFAEDGMFVGDLLDEGEDEAAELALLVGEHEHAHEAVRGEEFVESARAKIAKTQWRFASRPYSM